MIKRILQISTVTLVCLVFGVWMLGTIWQQTDHGTLDFNAAIILKIRNAFLKGEVLHPEKMRADARSRAKTLQGRHESNIQTIEIKIPGNSRGIPLRIYSPTGIGPFPILLFYHGGGWVIGDLNTADTACRFIANRARCLVVSVGYRLAPEHPFPAAIDDAYFALQWMKAHGGIHRGDPSRIVVSGSSSGGNLAAIVALMSRDRCGPRILLQVLIYPATDLSGMRTPSHRFFKEGYGLTREHMLFFIDCYLPDKTMRTHPYVSPLLADNLAGLPPAIIITAGFDILRDDGRNYAERLEKSGVKATHIHYPTMIHGFITMDRIFREAGEALSQVSDALRQTFYSDAGPPE